MNSKWVTGVFKWFVKPPIVSKTMGLLLEQAVLSVQFTVYSWYTCAPHHPTHGYILKDLLNVPVPAGLP